MKKKNGTQSGKKYMRCNQRPCLMAYTLNNSQPVICTLVADQPYFYMDENQIADDDILGLADVENFEKEIADIKRKIDAYDRLSQGYERAPERTFELFQLEAINICEKKIDGIVASDTNTVDAVLKNISQSRMAKSLLEFAQEHHVYIIETTHEETARYDAENSAIYLNPQIATPEATLLCVRELRRHWQHRNGVMINPLTFQPDHAILINRAQNADLCVSIIRSAWEMQLSGLSAVWQYIERSGFSDIARVYAREAHSDFRSINTGKASYAVFEGWFMSERCRHQDKKLIQQMLADHNGYVFDHPELSKTISIELIRSLGELPYGKNYLSTQARAVAEDPLFTEVRDRSNANFLWFVKFERSFRETEQGLQSEGSLTGSEILSGQDPFIAGEADHDSTSKIVRLNLGPDTDGENVIHVQFGKGKSA